MQDDFNNDKPTSKLNKKIIFIVFVITALSVITVPLYSKFQKSKIKQVSISSVSRRNLSQSSTVTGNIESKYRNYIQLNPSQKVLKVCVKEGQIVKKGTILVKLDTSDYESDLKKQQLNLKNAQLILNELNGTGPESEISSAESNLSAAQVKFENAQRNYNDANKKFNQSKSLLDSGVISQNQYDSDKKNLDDAASLLKSSKSSLVSSQKSLSDVKSKISSKITNQKNNIDIIKQDMEKLSKKISESALVSTIDGKVLKMDAKENEFPKNGDAIIIDNTSQYRVSVDLTQYDAIKSRKGQRANIKIKGLDKVYKGIVTEIGELAESKAVSGNSTQESKVNVKVTLEKPDSYIKPGYEADVDFIFNERENVKSIEFNAVKEDKSKGGKYVYKIDSTNRISKVYIKTGVETQYYVEILEGLKEGDKCVLNPPEDINDGDIVKGVQSNN